MFDMSKLMSVIETANETIAIADREVSRREQENFDEIERRYRDSIRPALIQVQKFMEQCDKGSPWLQVYMRGQVEDLHSIAINKYCTKIWLRFDSDSIYMPGDNESFYSKPCRSGLRIDQVSDNRAKIALVLHWDVVEKEIANEIERATKKILAERAESINKRDKYMQKIEEMLNAD